MPNTPDGQKYLLPKVLEMAKKKLGKRAANLILPQVQALAAQHTQAQANMQMQSQSSRQITGPSQIFKPRLQLPTMTSNSTPLLTPSSLLLPSPTNANQAAAMPQKRSKAQQRRLNKKKKKKAPQSNVSMAN